MDNNSTTKHMISVVMIVLISALLLAWLLKGKDVSETKNLKWVCFKDDKIVAFSNKRPKLLDNGSMVVYNNQIIRAIKTDGCVIK